MKKISIIAPVFNNVLRIFKVNAELVNYFKDKYKNDSFNVQVYAFSYNFLNIDKGKCYLEFES